MSPISGNYFVSVPDSETRFVVVVVVCALQRSLSKTLVFFFLGLMICLKVHANFMSTHEHSKEGNTTCYQPVKYVPWHNHAVCLRANTGNRKIMKHDIVLNKT